VIERRTAEDRDDQRDVWLEILIVGLEQIRLGAQLAD